MKKGNIRIYGYATKFRTWYGTESSWFVSLLSSVCSFLLPIAVLCVLAVSPTHCPILMNIVTAYA